MIEHRMVECELGMGAGGQLLGLVRGIERDSREQPKEAKGQESRPAKTPDKPATECNGQSSSISVPTDEVGLAH